MSSVPRLATKIEPAAGVGQFLVERRQIRRHMTSCALRHQIAASALRSSRRSPAPRPVRGGRRPAARARRRSCRRDEPRRIRPLPPRRRSCGASARRRAGRRCAAGRTHRRSLPLVLPAVRKRLPASRQARAAWRGDAARTLRPARSTWSIRRVARCAARGWRRRTGCAPNAGPSWRSPANHAARPASARSAKTWRQARSARLASPIRRGMTASLPARSTTTPLASWCWPSSTAAGLRWRSCWRESDRRATASRSMVNGWWSRCRYTGCGCGRRGFNQSALLADELCKRPVRGAGRWAGPPQADPGARRAWARKARARALSGAIAAKPARADEAKRRTGPAGRRCDDQRRDQRGLRFGAQAGRGAEGRHRLLCPGAGRGAGCMPDKQNARG